MSLRKTIRNYGAVLAVFIGGFSVASSPHASAAPTGCTESHTYVAMDSGWQATSKCTGGNGHYQAYISCSNGYQNGNLDTPGGFGSFTPGCGLGASYYVNGTALYNW